MKTLLIIKREYLTKVRNKSFVIMTFLSPFIFVGIFALVAYLSNLNSDTVRRISVLDHSGLFSEEFHSSPHLQYKILPNISLADAKEQAEKEAISGLLYIPKTEKLEDLSKAITFYSEDSPSITMMSDLNNMLEAKVNTLKLKEAGMRRPYELKVADLHRHVQIENASVVVLNFTLQFIPPSQRDALLKRIHDSLNPGGILVLSEKIRFPQPQLDSLFIDMYHRFKEVQGYSALEISQKRTALENVLIPETLATHRDRLREAGFSRVDTWFQCFNFASIIAFK